MKLKIIVGSTRPERVTERVANWVLAEARNLTGTEVELIDLKNYSLPFMNEGASPRFNQNRRLDETTRRWLSKIQEGDAYVFVTPEYNHSIPGVLKNAIDYITWEMVKKPATVVSHGTVGGARATMHLKEILSESRAAVIPTQVALPKAIDSLDESGVLDPDLSAREHGPQTSLRNMLAELLWYSEALSAARTLDSNQP